MDKPYDIEKLRADLKWCGDNMQTSTDGTYSMRVVYGSDGVLVVITDENDVEVERWEE